MNFNSFQEWKTCVTEMNNQENEISKKRDKCYKFLSDMLKKIFDNHELPVDEMKFSDDGSVIEVWLDGNTSNQISFSRQFLIEIGMPFSVNRRIVKTGDTMLVIELYPLEEN